MLLKCKMCGGDLEIAESVSVVECEYCGTQQTVPKADNEKKMTLFSRANRLRLANEFDKAAGIYESIVAEFPEEAEAYWGLVLCRYGIEYVDDPTTGRKVPTCHRSSFDSIMDDSDFEQATENADVVARRVYRDEAKAIEEIRKGILEVSGKENPYDIFICYKEIDENGNRTIDSVIAQDVYDALTEKGYRVFFSRISLEDKLGSEYEPYIFAALNSAKVMLVLGTDYEYFNAVWVKNEWSRFLALIASGQKKTLIPCYKDIDAYDMPKEFVKLQGQDMAKIGAIQDLLRGIEKIIGLPVEDEGGMEIPKAISDYEKRRIEEAENNLEQGILCLEDEEWEDAYYYFNEANLGIGQSNPKFPLVYLGRLCAQLEICTIDEFKEGTPALIENNGVKSFKISAQIKAGYYCLENEWWDDADSFFDEAINIDAKCAAAYIGKMMAENRISKEDDIADYFYGKGLDINGDKNYKKALRFAEVEYRAKLESYSKQQSPTEAISIEAMERLAEIRKQNEKYKGLILANGDRTVGIKDNGKVLAVGDNRHGECNTGTWQDVVSVALGDFHTVGLKKNGTVIAAGGQGELANSGQCQTSGWSDITAIAAASSFTIGLKTNGSFVHCGDAIRGRIEDASASGILAGVTKNILGQMIIPKSMDWSAVYAGPGEIYGLTKDGRVETINHYGTGDRWRNIIEVIPSKDGDSVIGLCKDGTVVAAGKNEHGQCDVMNWRDIVAVVTGGTSIYAPFTVGLKSNGTVLATGSNEYRQCKVSDWTDIVAIAAGANHTVGLKSNGTVVAVGQNDDGQCNTSDWYDIVAIVAGDDHTVGLKSDGTVVAIGKNNKGQCNTENWFSIGVNAPPSVKDLDENKVAEIAGKINEAKKYSRLIAPCIQRTFALMPNGKVIVAENIEKILADNADWKDQTWNYCDTSSWEDIIAISGKGFHVVGLRKDGKVVATGYNNRSNESTNCRCDTSGWRDIIAISATVPYTVGVQRNGCVVKSGAMMSDNDQNKKPTYVNFDISDWRDIVDVSAQSYYCLGLKSDGTVVYRGVSEYIKQYKIEEAVSTWENIVAISAGFVHALGLREDGTVVAAGDNTYLQCEVAGWKDCTAISTGIFQSLGLRKDGQVYVSGTNVAGCVEGISKLKDVKAIYAGHGNSVCLMSDDDVIRVGSNDLEQCNVKKIRFFNNLEKRKKQQELEEEVRRWEQSKLWQSKGLCRYCGGQIGGIFEKKCKKCGRTN